MEKKSLASRPYHDLPSGNKTENNLPQSRTRDSTITEKELFIFASSEQASCQNPLINACISSCVPIYTLVFLASFRMSQECETPCSKLHHRNPFDGMLNVYCIFCVFYLSFLPLRFDLISVRTCQLLHRLDRWIAAALIDVVDADRSLALVIASDTGVMEGAGVVDRELAALRLCCMWALTRWPAARALQRESSPARTAAPMIRAKRRALSPGFVGWEPRTPSMSSMALWGSRIVPPPRVPTSREGMETEI
jgi:hypothetical protein